MHNAPIPVKLDRVRHVAWSNSAYYRATLITLSPQRSLGHLVQMIWMCLVPDDAAAFPTPEHLSAYVDPKDAKAIEALWEAYAKLTAKPKGKEAEEKNVAGSTD